MTNYKAKTEKEKCIFCEIAQGRMKPLGEGTFWEDDEFMAWLSPFPNTKGFSVIIPKKHYGSDVLKMPEKILCEFILAAEKVAKKLETSFTDVGRVGLMMEGMGIDHAHIKLFPMHGTGYLKKGRWKQFHSDERTYYKNYPGFIASNDGPKAKESEIRKMAKKLSE